MLSSITLKCFQPHRDLTIPLSAVTVLVGDNGHGKSAVLRALLWSSLGRWDGAAGEQITWGEESCEVTLAGEGHTLSRLRSKSKNVYVLDGQEYSAGQGVPQVVKDFLRLGEDNFQGQHDPAFWITLTGGQAAGALNEIFNLSAVDDALANAASELTKARSREAAASERLETAVRIKREYAWAEEAARSYKDLEVRHGQVEGVQKEILHLEEAEACLREAEERGSVLAAAHEELTALLESAERYEQQQGESVGLKRLLEREEEICRTRSELAKAEKILERALRGACPLCLRPPPPACS